MIYLLRSSIILALPLLLGTVASSEGADIVVAYREDAPPFSQKVDAGYAGFVVDVCETAISDIGLEDSLQRIGVTAENRFSVIENSDAHILCGPVSMTPDRLKQFIFSIPIFVSGISYATILRPALETGDPRKARAAILQNTTAFSSSSKELMVQNFGMAGQGIFDDLAYLRGDSDNQHYTLENVVIVDSYVEGFIDLCAGDVQYLIGDVDILNSFLMTSELPDNCELVVAPRTLTREMYGIVFEPNFVESPYGNRIFRNFQSSIFEQFQNGAATEYFKQNFPSNVVMSRELRQLFTLYVREVGSQ